MKDEPAIAFYCSVEQVRTMADGSLRVILSLPEDAIPVAAMLMECKRAGIVLDVVCTERDDRQKHTNY